MRIFQRQGLLLSCLLLIISAAYANTFGVPFIFDDLHNIANNHFIKINSLSWLNLWQAASNSPSSHRWLPNISFALNYYTGGLEVLGYHLVNLAVHLMATIALYLLFVTTLSLDGRRWAAETAFFATLLWALHPVQTNSVTYIVQRMTSMATLFNILALLWYAWARIARTSSKKILLFGLSGVAGLMALASKENAAMLPVTIAAYEFFFLSRPGSLKYLGNKRHLAMAGLALTTAIILCVIFLGTRPLDAIMGTYSHRDFTLPQRLLTEARVIIHYLCLLLLPLPGRLNLAHDFPLSCSLTNPPATLAAILTLVALLTAMVRTAKHQRLLAFAIFWFLANLAIESSFIGLELIFEHRLYLPSIFIILAFAAWVTNLSRRRPAVGRLLLTGIAIGFAVLTWQRNTTWQSSVSLWTDAAAKSPNLARVFINLGKEIELTGDHAEAEKLLIEATRLAPDQGEPYVTLGRLYERTNRLPEAEKSLRMALTKKFVNAALAHNNLSIVYYKMKNVPAALAQADMAVEADAGFVDAYVNRGVIYGSMGQHRQAEAQFRQALRLAPEKDETWYRLGIALEHQQRFKESIGIFSEMLGRGSLEPATLHLALANVYLKTDEIPLAFNHAEKSLQLSPNNMHAHLTLGLIFLKNNDQTRAFQAFTNAWQNGFDMVGQYIRWSRLEIDRGNPEKAAAFLYQALKLAPTDQQLLELLGKIPGALRY